jgi:GT2 family glycosyltransferase
MSLPTVYIGIVTYNSLRDLPRCLDSLASQTYPHIHLTIVDNASGDGTAARLTHNAPPGTQIICNDENIGFGQAHNQIINSLVWQHEDLYLLLNPDAQFISPDYIAALVTAIQNRPHFGWATGQLRCLDHPERLYSAGHALFRDGYAVNIGQNLAHAVFGDETREVFGAPAVALLVKRALLETIRYRDDEVFDRHMFMYGEDVDFDWRARLGGWRCLYLAEVQAVHRGSQASEALRLHALTNRYLSVMKNAYLGDLLFYNLPVMLIHGLLRLVITPRAGLWMVARLLRLTPAMLRRRTKARIPKQEIHSWFNWARTQPTGAPKSWMARWRSGKIRDSESEQV